MPPGADLDPPRRRLAPYETPKDIEFVDTLPMTATGKLQRNVLKQLEIDRAARTTPPGGCP